MKAHELKDLSMAELEARVKDTKETLQKLYFNRAVAGQVENPAEIKKQRRELARLYTVINELQTASKAS